MTQWAFRSKEREGLSSHPALPCSHFVYTAPVGLEGVQRMSSRDLGVSAGLSFSALMMKPSSGVVSTMTGVAWARVTISV